MDRRLIKRFVPNPDRIREIRALAFLGRLLHEPNLWHINRHSVSRAFLLGVFWCFIPMPFQSIPAAATAIWFNANLPLTIIVLWISNPVTMGPMLYGSYVIGTWVLGKPAEATEFKMEWAWLSERLVEVGIPLYIGALLMAVVFSLATYVVIQYLWRRRVRVLWHRREAKRQARKAEQAPR